MTNPRINNFFISFVLPVLNESESLGEFYQSLTKVISTNKWRVELIFINDGSKDGSREALLKLKRQDKRVAVINFRKTLGKSTALNEGFRISKGQIIATLDTDLQDRPENLPAMIHQLNQGYDMVIGWKKDRHDPLEKRVWSKVFNWWLVKTSGLKIHDFNCGLKVMRSQVTREVELYGELHRFFPWLAAQKGFRISEIPVFHQKRFYGKSKYGWTRIIVGALDFLTIVFLNKFADRPLHLFGTLGVIMEFGGLFVGMYLSILHFQGIKIGDRPLLIFSVLAILAGLQLISLGLLAEMIVSKRREPMGKLE